MSKEERTKPDKKEKKKKTAELESPSKEEPKKEKTGRNEKGQFTKGHEKRGGRQMGTKNRNSNIRDRLKEQLEPLIDKLGEYLLKIQQQEGAAEMLKTAEKYMPYCWPKYSSMAIGADLDRPISEEERLLELDQMYTKKQISINIRATQIVNNDIPRGGDDDPDDDPDFDLSQLEALAVGEE